MSIKKKTLPLIPPSSPKFRQIIKKSMGNVVEKKIDEDGFQPTAASMRPDVQYINNIIESGCQYYFISFGGSFNKHLVLGVDGFTDDDDWTLGY